MQLIRSPRTAASGDSQAVAVPNSPSKTFPSVALGCAGGRVVMMLGLGRVGFARFPLFSVWNFLATPDAPSDGQHVPKPNQGSG